MVPGVLAATWLLDEHYKTYSGSIFVSIYKSLQFFCLREQNKIHVYAIKTAQFAARLLLQNEHDQR